MPRCLTFQSATLWGSGRYGGDDGDLLAAETYLSDPLKNTGIYLLNTAPGLLRQKTTTYCADQRAIYLVDHTRSVASLAPEGRIEAIYLKDVGIAGENAAGIESRAQCCRFFPAR